MGETVCARRTGRQWRTWATAWELAALTMRYPRDAVLAGAVVAGEWVDAVEEIAATCGLALPDGWVDGLPAGGKDERTDAVEIVGADAGDRAAGASLAGETDGAAGEGADRHAAEASDEANLCADEDAAAAGAQALGEGGAALPGAAKARRQQAVSAMRRELRVEATRLFVGAPEPLVSPYEGVWRAAQDGVHALLMVNPHTMDVERFMHACGLKRPAGTQEPLDHVATECELLEHLALRAAADEPAEGVPGEGALPGGSASAAYARFCAEHASTWMADLAAELTRVARHPLYRAAGIYLGALVAAEAAPGEGE